MNMNKSYQQSIKSLVEAICPFDSTEARHRQEVLDWINSGEPLCRTKKPATPPKHLVSYFTLLDPEKKNLLLVDHKKALLWLPPGGHVEPDEHPNNTAHRELEEELNIQLPLLQETPIFLTVTETVGTTAGHIDVSLWYVFKADSSINYLYDQSEFNEIKWFPLDKLPLERTDPHMLRFCNKLIQALSIFKQLDPCLEHN